MKIALRSRLNPFSHLPGVACIVPFSNQAIQIFPALLRLGNEEIPLNVKGPVRNFTVVQNLEKGEIGVFGETSSGLLRYIIYFSDNQIKIAVKKPLQNVLFESPDKMPSSSPKERLHLGMHKDLDWELVKRRADLKEIFPVWHRLGQIMSDTPYIMDASLLRQCYDAVEARQKGAIFSSFENLFAAGFHGIMVPWLHDANHLGFELPPIEANPFALISEGSKLIRSLFVSFKNNELELLPVLPPEIVSGKLCNFNFQKAIADLEWSKRLPRRLVIHPQDAFSSTLVFPKNIHKARLRLKDNEKGVMVNSGTLFDFEPGKPYYFDQFAN